MLYLAVIFPFIAHFLPIENKKIKLAISIAPAIFIILFRWGLGTDYFSYEYLYRNHDVRTFAKAMASQTRSMEVVFRVLIYIFKSLGFSFQVFVAFISLLIYGVFLKWLDDIDQDMPLSIMLLNGMFLIVWTLGGLRQGLVLAIGTYCFFNKKVNLKVWQSILVILLLGQIHASAYIYIVLLVIKHIEFKKVYLFSIIALSLLFTIIPYYKLFEPFSDIRIVGKFLTYVTGSGGFWDFPGLVRLSFVIFILTFYNLFAKDKYMKKLADMSIIGFSFYFLLKSSEITASRINIFTFILIVPLFVYLSQQFLTKKILYPISLIALFMFSILYLEKDLLATQRETGKETINIVYKLELFNDVHYKDYYLYDNQYSFLAFNSGLCKATKEISYPRVRPIEEKGNIVIRNQKTDRYGVINENGDWIINPIYKEKPELYGDILVFKRPDFTVSYFNLDQQYTTKVYATLSDYKYKKQKIEDEKPKESNISLAKYNKELSEHFINLDKIKNPKLLTYKLPFEYNVLTMEYSNNDYYFYLDENLELHNGMIFNKEIRFDQNNMAYAKTFCGHVVLNSNGDIVYD